MVKIDMEMPDRCMNCRFFEVMTVEGTFCRALKKSITLKDGMRHQPDCPLKEAEKEKIEITIPENIELIIRTE